MPDSPDIVVLVLILIPGLIGYGLYQALTPMREPSWTTRFVVAVVLSILSYVELYWLHTLISCLPNPELLFEPAAQRDLRFLFVHQTLLSVVCASILTIPNAIALVLCHNIQLLHRIASKFHLTAKTGFSSNWDDVFWNYRRTCWALIQFKDGSAAVGWIRRNSDASEERSILLEHVRQYNAEGQHFDWPENELLLLANIDDVKFIRLIPVEPEMNDGPESQKPIE